METEKITEQTSHALRPVSFDDFIGQSNTINNLRVFVSGAKQRGEPLCHLLLVGQPGLGKTSLAVILANEMGARLVTVNAPSIKSKGELASLLVSLKKSDILFLDEIHSLHPKIEEVLYPAMEDFKLVMMAGNNALNINLEPFTLIGATTREGMLQRPLRDRFGEIVRMHPYTNDELSIIIMNNVSKLDLTCDVDAANVLAMRSRGTPRIANRMLHRIRDFAQYRGLNHVTVDVVEETCDRLGIDSLGLDETSQKYLRILIDKDTAVGFNVMTSLLGESKDTIEDVVEPHLMQLGLIERTPKGRTATTKARRHLYPEH
jgi:Holliday junction DNA helicase RuvB